MKKFRIERFTFFILRRLPVGGPNEKSPKVQIFRLRSESADEEQQQRNRHELDQPRSRLRRLTSMESNVSRMRYTRMARINTATKASKKIPSSTIIGIP